MDSNVVNYICVFFRHVHLIEMNNYIFIVKTLEINDYFMIAPSQIQFHSYFHCQFHFHLHSIARDKTNIMHYLYIHIHNHSSFIGCSNDRR